MTAPELPTVLTDRGAYVHWTAAAFRAIAAGDTAARNRAWNFSGRFVARFHIRELPELDREARALAYGPQMLEQVTEDQARAMKRGSKVHDNSGRTWTKQTTLWHGPDGRWPFHWVADHYGPMWPTSATTYRA